MGSLKKIKFLFPYLKEDKVFLIFSAIFGLFAVSSKVAIPFITGLAIDQMKKGNFSIQNYLFFIIGFVILGSICRYLFDFLVAILNQKLIKKMRIDLFASYQQLPFSYLDTHSNGDLLKRLIADLENIQNGLILGASILYEGLLQILITIFMMMYVNWILALVVICLTPLSVIVSRFISKSNSKYFKQQSKVEGELASYSLETLNNLGTVASYNLSNKREARFDEINKINKKANFKAFFATSWINPSTRLVNNIIYASVTLIGAFLCLETIKNGSFAGTTMTVGFLSTFLSYSYQYMTPFNDISSVSTEVIYAITSLERVNEIISAPKDINDGKLEIKGDVERLSAKNITFSYNAERKIIKNFNLDFYKGHKIALVGPTGCGKTTIVNLLMRFYDPQEGSFEFNEISSFELEKDMLRSHIGLVLQESFLLHASIKDNICFGTNYSDEEVVNAAKKARAHEFIIKLKDGYDTIISNDSELSYGQRQLISIARIIINKPEIIILDEATSNIDLRTELMLSKSLDELMEGKTSVVIAHRLSTIKNAHHIVVLKDGEIVQQGNFKQLVTEEGLFKEIYNSQFA